MQLIGQAVTHAAFGAGVVTNLDDHMLTVSFHGQQKKFIYPDAFDKFLTLRSDALQNKVESVLQQEAAEKETKLHAMEDEIEHKSLLVNMRITPKSQAAFDVSSAPSPFSAWTVSSGTYLSGYARGEVRIPDRLKPNSMCLLTRLENGQPESERRIIGAFMVPEDFLGTCCHDGIIPAHPDYRLQLPEDQQPLFWDYFPCDSARRCWGRIAMKYFTNQTAQEILHDIALHTAEPDMQQQARQFYAYFCKMNRLTPQRFPLSDN